MIPNIFDMRFLFLLLFLILLPITIPPKMNCERAIFRIALSVLGFLITILIENISFNTFLCYVLIATVTLWYSMIFFIVSRHTNYQLNSFRGTILCDRRWNIVIRLHSKSIFTCTHCCTGAATSYN